MNQILPEDKITFEQNHPEAILFLFVAHLRFELHCIATNKTLYSLEKKRARELFEGAPACQEAWFQNRSEIKELKKSLGIE